MSKIIAFGVESKPQTQINQTPLTDRDKEFVKRALAPAEVISKPVEDPRNLNCGCKFNPKGLMIVMCEEAWRLRMPLVKDAISESDLQKWYAHFANSQPTILAKKRKRALAEFP